MFPEREITESQTETDDAVLQSQTEIEDELPSDENEQNKEESESIAQPKENENNNEEETVIEQNHFFPTNIGLTFCVNNAIKTVDVEFNFGLYYQPKHSEIKIAISEIGFNSFFDMEIPFQLPFKDILKYQDGFMFLSRELKGDKGGRGNVRSGEYKDFDEFRKKDNIENREVFNHITRLEKLVGSRVWKRKSISIKKQVLIESTPKLIPITIDEKVYKELKVAYHIKTYEFKGKKYVKILLVNNSEPHPVKEFSNKKEALNKKCAYYEEIPVQVVDEMLYQSPPTLLFATVDKFAMLAWQEDGYKFFNSLDDDKLPPDLIIQDELHLLSGPLGSIVGIFESVVEMLCTKNGIGPKIIASTATTRNTDHQISKLYGNRKVNIFPPSGISHKDSFFAKESSSKRKYIGFIPTGKSTLDTQLQVLGHLLVARLNIYQKLNSETDNYWTIVSYYNSLKDVGKTSNKVSDEIKSNTSTLQHRLKGENHDLDFNYRRLENHTQELTSRVESHKIKEILKNLETKFHLNESEKGTKYLIDELIDLVLATNMISVGIDINRLNVMLINGIPRNIAEYIQATSRIGRKEDGLVDVISFKKDDILELKNNIKLRYKDKPDEYKKFEQIIDELANDWMEKINKYGYKRYCGNEDYLLKRPSEMDTKDYKWVLVQSMRDVDTSTYIQIKIDPR